MNAFVVVVAKPGRAIPPTALPWAEVDQPALPYEPTASLRWSDPTGRVLVRAWERPNPAFGIESHWSASADGLTLFVGHLWPKRTGWVTGRSWASQLAKRCRTGTVAGHVEDLTGVYSVVTLDPGGRGVIFNDPLGLRMIYTAEAADYHVYSSRADIAARVAAGSGSHPTRDPDGAGWLAYATYPVGDRTGFAEVSILAPGGFAVVDPVRGASSQVWSDAPWLPEPGDPVATGDLVEAVRDDIAAHLRVVVALPGTDKIGALTGGRDSRLVLAVLLAEGLTDAVTFRTLGNETLPDVVVAREIADRFGLDHSWGYFGLGPAEPYEQRARKVVALTSGMLNIWFPANLEDAGRSVHISGLCGEVMGTYFSHTSDVTSWHELDRRFSLGWRFGEAGLLRPGAHPSFERRARRSLFADPADGSSPRDLIDIFFLRHRLRRWTGITEEIDRSNRVFPLYSLAGIRAAFAIGSAKRRAEFLHYHVMQRACPELVGCRFAGKDWPAAILEGGGHSIEEPHVGPVPAEVVAGQLPTSDRRRRGGQQRSASMTVNRQLQRAALPERREAIRTFLDDPSNPVFDVVDRQRTLDSLHRVDDLDQRERQCLFGAATAAVWLGRSDEQS